MSLYIIKCHYISLHVSIYHHIWLHHWAPVSGEWWLVTGRRSPVIGIWRACGKSQPRQEAQILTCLTGENRFHSHFRVRRHRILMECLAPTHEMAIFENDRKFGFKIYLLMLYLRSTPRPRLALLGSRRFNYRHSRIPVSDLTKNSDFNDKRVRDHNSSVKGKWILDLLI
jgi:hypothetical protein